jgi:hypothetical protein
MTAKKEGKKTPVIDVVRQILWKKPVGTEFSYKTVAHIKSGQGAFCALLKTGEIKFKRMHKKDGERAYKIWVLTGLKKDDLSLDGQPICGQFTKKHNPDYTLLCGRSISSIPKEAVVVHRIAG